MARLLLESILFAATLIVLFYAHSLFSSDSYDLYDEKGGAHTISPDNLHPALPSPLSDPMSRELVDDVPRLYISRVRVNPLDWTCRMSGRADPEYSIGPRFWQLCQEGNAARWLLVVMLSLQGVVLIKHALDFQAFSRRREMPRTTQRLPSDDGNAGAEAR